MEVITFVIFVIFIFFYFYKDEQKNTTTHQKNISTSSMEAITIGNLPFNHNEEIKKSKKEVLMTNKLQILSEEYKKNQLNELNNYYSRRDNSYAPKDDNYSIEKSIVEYNSNIKNQKCGCQDWVKSRSKYQVNDPRRLCKHLIHLLDINKLSEELNYFKSGIEYYKSQEKGYKNNSYNFETIIDLFDKYKVEMAFDTNQWINIYSKDGFQYGLIFGTDYHICWASSKGQPDDYKKIELVLFDLLFEHISLTDKEKMKKRNELLEKHILAERIELLNISRSDRCGSK